MADYTTEKRHISLIRAGDTVIHCGEMKTVCASNIRSGGLFGLTIFGDSYRAGTQPVEVVKFNNPIRDRK